MTFYSAAYSAALTLGLILASPWWLFRMATTQRYREGLRQRLGAVPTALRLIAANKRVVWVHAVSVGEVLAASRLVAGLQSALGPGFAIVVSTTTRTGQALARQRFGASRVFYVPLDFAGTVRRYLDALNPAMLILMESELWPRLLYECRERSVPVAVVNARVSDRSFTRGLRFRGVWKHALRMPTLWLAQSDEDARRLVAMGARPNAVQAIGNLKYDIRAPKQGRIAELIKSLAQGRPIIVAGSTVGKSGKNEEYSLDTAYGGDIRNSLNALLVIAPRHPERFDEVWKIVTKFPTLKATQLQSGKTGKDAFAQFIEPQEVHRADIILLDTIGDLASVYSIATIAFVGGSLVPRGGHNPLEPAQFGVPVIMGPHFENFRDIVNKMTAADAIRIVQDEDELRSTLQHLLTHPEEADALGARGRAVFEQQQGATARTVSALLRLQ